VEPAVSATDPDRASVVALEPGINAAGLLVTNAGAGVIGH
jgi:hypothetical protein